MRREELLARIAPLLRGATYDGRKGMFVRAVPSADSAAPADRTGPLRLIRLDTSAVRSLAESESHAELAEALVSALSDTDKGRPHGVEIPEVGVLLQAESFDRLDVLEREHHDPEYSPPAPPAAPPTAHGSGRADIVRNRVALITGGAQGFGAGLIEGLTGHGCFCWIADINVTGARELAASINRRHGRTTARAVEADITDEASVERMAEEVALTTGGIDLLVSNAGVLRAAGVREMNLRDFRFVTDVNYIGYFLVVKHFSRLMALQNVPTGRYFTDIIQINSKSGLEGSNRNGAYAGSKFGGIGLTQSFALELVEDNIKVNAICPGNFFDGPLWSDPEKGLFVQYLSAGKVPGARTVEDVRHFYESKVPMKRGCKVGDVMRAVLYLVEQQYETGQALPVTGGQVMLG